MVPTDRDYLLNMARAEEFVKAARLCYDSGLHNAAATRAYYGVLHAAVAALVCFAQDQSAEALMDGRTHEKVAALFDERLVRRSKLFSGHKGVVHRLRDRRHDADYRSGVNSTEARDSVEKAKSFLGDVKRKMIDGKLYY